MLTFDFNNRENQQVLIQLMLHRVSSHWAYGQNHEEEGESPQQYQHHVDHISDLDVIHKLFKIQNLKSQNTLETHH